jgi:predicted HAD superfamily hydrolase
MNILFFLEPAIEFGNPLFRFATLRNSISPQIKTLNVNGNKIVTLVSAPVANKTIEELQNIELGTLAVVDPIMWMNGESYYSRSQRHLNEDYKNDEIERISIILHNSLPDNFEPDIIIVWESPAKYLSKIYPEAKVIYQMPGFFSRPPFANLISFEKSILDKTKAAVNTKKIIENKEALVKLRDKENQFLTTVSPVNQIIREIKADFQKIILLPLQIDNYFMVNGVIENNKTQFDILTDILSSLPKEYALLVTNYKSKDTQSEVLTDSGIKYLRSRFSNFIYYKETDDIPWVSQFITPLVDAVITISSSVGYQAAFWKKPLLTLGTSHLSEFSTAKNIDHLLEQISSNQDFDQDELIINTIRHKHLSMDFIASPGYVDWIQDYHLSGDFSEWSTVPVAERLIEERRESNLLQALGFFNSVRGESSIDHCQELSQQIIKHDIISFDVFDTLLYRPFKNPTDLFILLQEKARDITGIASLDFKTTRREAEKIAFHAALERDEGETTIDEIYAALSELIKIDDSTTNALMQMEMDAEKSLLYPRISGYKAFLEARNLNKRIIIISDMYLPERFIAELLDKNGYSGYERIYVSSTYKVKKHSGILFDVVLNDLAVSPASILHVGDNLEADVKKAKARGIKPFHLIKSSEVFSANSDFQIPWSRDENRHSLDWSMLLAVVGNKLHDNPYLPHRNNTLFGGSPIKLGYYGFGPLLLGYTKWLIESSINDGIETLYFLSRDGKIMKAAYDVVSKLYPEAPKSEYLLCSRRAVNLAKVESISDILDLLHVDFAHRVSLTHLLKHRFGVNIESIPDEVLREHGYSAESKLTVSDIPKLQNLFVEIQDILLLSASKERDNYLEYLNNSQIFNSDKNSIVDIGYAGTMQESLYKLSGSKVKIGGYYLITFRQALKRVLKNNLPIKGYLAEFIDRHDTYHNFCRHVPLYETLFSSTDTSFVRMGRNWNNDLYPVFMQNSPIEQKRENLVHQVHIGAIDFINDISKILGEYFKQLDIEPNKSLRVLDMYFTNPHPRDAVLLSGVMFEDAYGGTAYKTILPHSNNLNTACVWKNGHSALVKEGATNNSRNQMNNASPVKDKTLIVNKANSSPIESLNFSSKVLKWMLVLTLTEKKKNKLINKPRMFFNDSKNPFIKKIGRHYLKGLEKSQNI